MSLDVESLAGAAFRRDFLYDDPISYRGGVEETIRLLVAMLRRSSAVFPSAEEESIAW